MAEKKKYDRAVALAVANELVELMRPSVTRIEIAGSIRREKPLVSDVELVYAPRMVEVKDGLFDTKLDDAAADKIEAMLQWGPIIQKRQNVNGSVTWGSKNKLAVHVASGIPVDFFSTTEENFWMSLVIRTGSTESNMRLIEGAKRRGYHLHAYGTFSSLHDGRKIAVTSEREVFEIAGIAYVQPKDRT
jgi:DNA polymerase/3'-5' exonuclease PolX